MPRRFFVFLCAAAVPLVAYVFSLYPGVLFWDTGEMQTVPYIFGIAHPTGFPVYVLLGWVWSHAFAAGNVAWRMSLLSAVSTSVACAALAAALLEVEAGAWVAAFAPWPFAFGVIVWTRSTRAEVHTLALAFEALAFLYMLAWYRRGTPRSFIASAACAGCALATHPIALWSLPALAILAFFSGNDRPRLRVFAAGAIAFVLPLCAYGYMPLRSAFVFAHRFDPTLALGLPPGRPFWDYGHPANWPAFLWMISGAQFEKRDALLAFLNPHAYPPAFSAYAAALHAQFPWIELGAALAGAILLVRKDAKFAAAAVLAAAALVPFTFSYAIEADKDRYALFSFWIVALLAGYGLSAIRYRFGVLGGALLAVLGLAQIWHGRAIFDQRTDFTGPKYVNRVLNLTPRDAIVVAPWVYVTPLGYAAYVDWRAQDRIIVDQDVASANAPQYAHWLQHRPVYLVVESPLHLPGLCTQRTGSQHPLLLRVIRC